MKKNFHCITKVFLIFVALVLTGGFTVLKAKDEMPGVARIDKATVDLVKKEKPLTGVGPYSTMIVDTFEASDQFKKDYRDSLTLFQSNLVSNLKNKNKFAKVQEGGDSTAAGTIKVTGKIVDMRIANPGARFWGGAMAGSSFMDIYVKVTDVKTGKVIDEKIISSSNNPVGAAWSGGKTDMSLPSDMGEIVSEYLCTVIPSK